MPALQMSVVQGLLSSGTSALSAVGVIAPFMQTFFWQSPGPAVSTSVPSVVLLEPHVPELVSQVNVLQTVLVPQFVSVTHCTHAGAVALPLHIVLLP
jgi:hypothetical protein